MQRETIESYLQKEILVLDGAMGTELTQANLQDSDFENARYAGCSEILNVSKRDLIVDIHRKYIEAGANFLTTNTFGANRIVLGEYGLEDRVTELNQAAVSCIQEALKVANYTQDCFIVGDLGPSSKAYSVTGGITLAEIEDIYFEQAVALLDAGVDLFMFETVQDVLNLKASYKGIQKAFAHTGKHVPLWISVTIESTQTTLSGQNIDAFYTTIAYMNPFVVGLNCALGPKHLEDAIRRLHEISTCYVSFHPNAGLPDEEGNYGLSPEMFYEELKPMLNQRHLNIVGGCCGTTSAHIALLAHNVKKHEARPLHKKTVDYVSGLTTATLDSFVVVGERTNTIGSKIFRELIAENKYDEAVEIARNQVQHGAQVLDVCLANPDRDESADMLAFVRALRQSVKVPLMIDTTSVDVLKDVLGEVPGKMILNSVNFERGDAYFQEYVAIAKQAGAKIVVGLIDEEGMAVTLERKIAVFERLEKQLEALHIDKQEIIIDPLVFPIATGDENYNGAAQATLEAISYIASRGFYTVLGLSNISFGLPLQGRLYVNDVYLNQAKENGLTMALINAAHKAGDDEKAWEYATLLVNENTPENIDTYVSHIRSLAPQKATPEPVGEKLSPEDELTQKVITGTKFNLQRNIQLLLDAGMKPLDVINGPLMKGMDEVGVRFGNNELIVTEVLQSASVMKESVAYLEQFMTETEQQKRGKVILATVKGDVHDIGKNLVGIIFENNGYDVLDLGINVNTATIVEEVKRFKPDMIGLSGLLVKSAQQMVEVVSELNKNDISIPVLIGGAALTRRFVATKIALATKQPVFYCKDAMVGLDYANQLQSEQRELCIDENTKAQQKVRDVIVTPTEKPAQVEYEINVEERLSEKREPLDYKRHIIEATLQDVYRYVNVPILFSRHFGIKNENHPKYAHMVHRLEKLIQQYESEVTLKGIYQVFATTKQDQTILIDGTDIQFQFPRQSDRKRFALQDFLHETDSLGFMVVTAGEELFHIAQTLEAQSDYEGAHILKSLMLELAEGMAEYVHNEVRKHYRIDDETLSNEDIISGNYTGKRYSFGYPACPDLNDQEKLFQLLQPQDIDMHLSDSMMMSPLASVSAIVFYNEKATYFVV